MMNHQSRYQTRPSSVVVSHASSTSTIATVKAWALQGDSERLNHELIGPLRAPGSRFCGGAFLVFDIRPPDSGR